MMVIALVGVWTSAPSALDRYRSRWRAGVTGSALLFVFSLQGITQSRWKGKSVLGCLFYQYEVDMICKNGSCWQASSRMPLPQVEPRGWLPSESICCISLERTLLVFLGLMKK